MAKTKSGCGKGLAPVLIALLAERGDWMTMADLILATATRIQPDEAARYYRHRRQHLPETVRNASDESMVAYGRRDLIRVRMQDYVKGATVEMVRDNNPLLTRYRLRTPAAEATSRAVPIAEVVVEDRVRKDLGDIDALAGSIAAVGLMHPIVIDGAKRLVAGARRLKACELLGWKTIPARMITNLADAALACKAEMDENTCRKPFTMIEASDMQLRLAALYKPTAKAAKIEGGKKGGKLSGESRRNEASCNLQEASPGGSKNGRETMTVAAKATGYSAATLRKVREIGASGFTDLVEKISKPNAKVHPVYKEMLNRQGKAVPPSKPDAKPAAAELSADDLLLVDRINGFDRERRREIKKRING